MVELDLENAYLSTLIHRSDLKFLFLGPLLWPEQHSLHLYQDLEATTNSN